MGSGDSGIGERELRDYLLGRLEGSARDLVEEWLFADAAAYDALQVTRSQLIEEYQIGRLDAASRAACERLLLSSRDGAREAITAAALRNEYSAQEHKKSILRGRLRSFGAPALTAASLAGMAVFAFLYFGATKRADESSAREQRLQQAISEAERRTQAAQTPSPALIAGVVTYDLAPDQQTRGGTVAGEVPLRMNPTALSVDLRALLEGEPKGTYTARLRKSANPQILWLGSARQEAGSPLTFRVPASVFENGRYRLIVSKADEIVAESNFTVEKTIKDTKPLR